MSTQSPYLSSCLSPRSLNSHFDPSPSPSPSPLFQRPLSLPIFPSPLHLNYYYTHGNTNSNPSSSTTTPRFRVLKTRRSDRKLRVAAASMLHQNPLVSDLIASGLSGGIALSILRLFEETAKRGVFDQKLNRKLVHISIGAGRQGAILAALIPGVNILKVILVGSGIWKDDAIVKSMSRFGDRRELLKGPLYYATTIAVASAIYWRSSPIAIAAICNLCAGDGMADVVGRRFGGQKLPYNRNKSIAGSVAMVLSGFLASVAYMYYFASFGYVQESWEMVLGFFVVSVASAIVESLPISTELDDNLTVTLTSWLFGSLIF
ncbi:hypothetical protein Tsubulata_000464 [Turnera subulata]|uniref:Phytol kinase n=1 Tax=Turnera subulata TaxID=218843 RepID=A0A9Q0FZN2_9ROSI|nr:hypothetical protein Tsubulata_000464 [Turnera subulata]